MAKSGLELIYPLPDHSAKPYCQEECIRSGLPAEFVLNFDWLHPMTSSVSLNRHKDNWAIFVRRVDYIMYIYTVFGSN